MREEDEKIAAMRVALKVGDDLLDKGQGVAYTPHLMKRAATKAKANARRGKGFQVWNVCTQAAPFANEDP